MSAIPHDLSIERALIGGVLAFPGRIDAVLDAVEPEDFHSPLHAAAFDAMRRLHRRGDRIETVVLLDELRRSGWTPEAGEVVAWTAEGSLNAPAMVDALTRLSVARRVLGAALAVAEEARAAKLEPGELIDLARESLGSIDAPAVGDPSGLSTVTEFLATSEAKPPPWVVPGMLRQGWRCVIVAPEGAGKSVAARQIAQASAAGVHPFAHTPIPPVRTLLVDLENPDDAIAETLRPIAARAADVGQVDPDRGWIWRQPGGIDLRTRHSRAELVAVLQRTRPDLVCLGPLYKAYRTQARESDELVAAEVQSVLDDLRTRFGFALLLEHHAPKGDTFGREMKPYGSSLWLRWPELGLKLTPGDGEKLPRTTLTVGRWRIDRMKNNWPNRLERGPAGGWPWQGWWRDGMDDPR